MAGPWLGTRLPLEVRAAGGRPSVRLRRPRGVVAPIVALALGAAVLTPSISMAKSLPPDVQQLLQEFGHTIEAQQRMIAAQEQRLAEMEQRLVEAEQRLVEADQTQTRQQQWLEGLTFQLDALPAKWLDEYGTVTVTPGGGLQNAIYQSYGGGPFYLAQTKPRAPQPVAPKAPGPVPPKQGEPPAETVQEERPESVKARDELLAKVGAVLLPAGTLQVEPRVDYSHVSTDRVAISGFTIFEAIVIGLIRVDEIDRDIVTAALDVRYGVTDRFQLEAHVPYIYRQDTEILGVGTANQSKLTFDGHGLGDVEISGSYQVLTQDGFIPGTVLRLRGRFPTGQSAFDIETQTVDVAGRPQERLVEPPTGSGFFAAGLGSTFIWRADPVAFFAGGGYTFNLPEDQGKFGNVDPGDTVEFFAGMNVGLSDQVGISFAFVDQITFETEVEGEKQIGTDLNDARLAIGASVGLNPFMSILATASAGLTDDSPDFIFSVSLPISISLF